MKRENELKKMSVVNELVPLAESYGLDIDEMRKDEIIAAIISYESKSNKAWTKQKRAPRNEAKTKLKQLRIKAGLTQSEVASFIGVPLASYSNYEQGAKNFDLTKIGVLLKACIILNCRLEDLIESDELRNTVSNYMRIIRI